MPEQHPKEHKSVKKTKRSLPAAVYELAVVATAGWTVYLSTDDWKQAVGAALAWLAGLGTTRIVAYGKARSQKE